MRQRARLVGGAAIVASSGVCFLVGLSTRGAQASARSLGDAGARPARVALSATIRDFRGHAEAGGHSDFDVEGHDAVRIDLVEGRLSDVPTIKSLVGVEIASEFQGPGGAAISPRLARASDTPGALVDGKNKVISSRASFEQWFRDVPGVNKSRTLTLTMNRDAGTGGYVFDAAEQEPYRSRGGFLPIDGELFQSAERGRNNFFTMQVAARFTYRDGAGQQITLAADDDAWVYVDGRLVIDLGGVHSLRSQTVDLDRLGLVAGRDYELNLFHAQRRAGSPWFRLESTVPLRGVVR